VWKRGRRGMLDMGAEWDCGMGRERGENWGGESGVEGRFPDPLMEVGGKNGRANFALA
jgi:hypothetical protein